MLFRSHALDELDGLVAVVVDETGEGLGHLLLDLERLLGRGTGCLPIALVLLPDFLCAAALLGEALAGLRADFFWFFAQVFFCQALPLGGYLRIRLGCRRAAAASRHFCASENRVLPQQQPPPVVPSAGGSWRPRAGGSAGRRWPRNRGARVTGSVLALVSPRQRRRPKTHQRPFLSQRGTYTLYPRLHTPAPRRYQLCRLRV